MKKILLMLMLCFSFVVANAQIATENRKALDNIYVGVEAGVTTPLNFNSMYPLNPVAGIKIGKEFTPIIAIEAEGLAVFGDNFYRYGINSSTPVWEEGAFNVHKDGSMNTFVKATNVGANLVLNWSNALWGYKGTPRVFEVKTNTGLGWLHYFGDFTTNKVGGYKPAGRNNVLTAKTAIDLVFNIGNKKAHTLTLSPTIYWGLNEESNIKFNKNYAQFGLMLGYTYHFKTSNGTHHFKTYDVGAMIGEIDRLNEELAKKPTEVVVEKVITASSTNAVAAIQVPSTYVIQFAKNSFILSNAAKEILDGISGSVNITASASPEGTKNYNQTLSEKRANVVAEYLTKKGVKVNSVKGIGCVDNNSNRIAIITSY
jgi:outer membrane protein OmpA-like peptidoglycan-associated protein